MPPLSLGLGGGGGLTRASKERESTSAGFRGTETDANLFHERKKKGSLTYHLANDDDDLLSGNENI